MTRNRFFFSNLREIRVAIDEVVQLSDDLHALEEKLIEKLYKVDQEKYFIRYGFKSLTGFCHHSLKFSRFQSQRLVTRVRRYEPVVNIGKNRESDLYPGDDV